MESGRLIHSKALKRRLKMADMDVVEINEAFASQVLACVKELEPRPSSGHGETESFRRAIAFGHPNG